MIENFDQLLHELLLGNMQSAKKFSIYLHNYRKKFDNADIQKALSLLRADEHKTNSYALWALAMMRHFSLGIEKDDDQTIALLDQAIQLDNNLLAMKDKAYMCTLENETYHFPNYDEAQTLYEKASSLGFGPATNGLGKMYERGYIGGENNHSDYEKAKAYYELAIQQGNAYAAMNLAFLYKDGRIGSENGTPNYLKAKKYFELAIQLGCTNNTYYMLGRMYQNGLIGKENNLPNYAKAEENFRQAIKYEQDDFAACHLGFLYQRGYIHEEGGHPNYEKAKEYYELAMALNNKNTYAHFRLGELYYFGYVGKKNNVPDYLKAKDYYELAAKDKNGRALKELGFLYHKGCDGVPKNPVKAKEYYELAIEAGNWDAYYNLAVIYEFGQIDNQPNISKAIEYYELGVQHKVAKAATALSCLYGVGKTGKEYEQPDYIKSQYYAELALNFGDDVAAGILGDIYRMGVGTGEASAPNLPKAIEFYQQSIHAHFQPLPNVFNDFIIHPSIRICAAISTLKTFSHPDIVAIQSSWDTFFKKEFDLSQKNEAGNNLLQYALLKKPDELFLLDPEGTFANYLIDTGAGINEINHADHSALEIAVMNGSTTQALKLLLKGAELRVEKFKQINQSPLILFLNAFIRENDFYTVKKILKEMKVNDKSFNEFIYLAPLLLFSAIECENILIVKWLLKYIKNEINEMYDGEVFLARAIKNHHDNFDIIHLLLAKGANIHTPFISNGEKISAIRWAVKNNDTPLVKFMLRHAKLVKVNERECNADGAEKLNGPTLLYEAIKLQSAELVNLLLDYGANPNGFVMVKDERISPLHQAILIKDSSSELNPVVSNLIQYGANVNEITEMNGNSKSLLKIIILRRNIAAVEIFLNYIDPKTHPEFNDYLKCAKGEIIGMLLDAGADMSFANTHLYKALEEFSFKPHSDKKKDAIYPFYLLHAVKQQLWEELICFIGHGADPSKIKLNLLSDKECLEFGNFIHSKLVENKKELILLIGNDNVTQLETLEQAIEKRLMETSYPGLHPALTDLTKNENRELVISAVRAEHAICDLLDHIFARYQGYQEEYQVSKLPIKENDLLVLSDKKINKKLVPLFLSFATASAFKELAETRAQVKNLTPEEVEKINEWYDLLKDALTKEQEITCARNWSLLFNKNTSVKDRDDVATCERKYKLV